MSIKHSISHILQLEQPYIVIYLIRLIEEVVCTLGQRARYQVPALQFEHSRQKICVMLVGCFGATKLTKHEVNVTRPRQQRVKLGQTLIKRLHVDVFAMIEGGGGIYKIVPALVYLQMGRVLQIYILCKCRAE